MSIEAVAPPTERRPELGGQTIGGIGGSAGKRAGDAEACPGRGRRADPDGAQSRAAADGGSRARRSERRDVDADDSAALETFFAHLEGPIDHVMVTAGGPYYAPLAEMDFDEARRALGEHPMLMVGVARHAAGKVRPGGTLLFMGGTGVRHVGVGITSATRVALPALTASLAPEIAPVRVNLIAAGFVDTALSASLPRRSARSTARRAPRDASDRAGGRTGRRRRAGRPHHGQHRADGGDVRHRRRPAAP